MSATYVRSEASKERARVRARERYWEDVEASRVALRERYARDPQHFIGMNRKYRQENRERIRRHNREAHYRAPHKTRARVQVRRARILAVLVERVDPLVLWQMHGGFCGICHDYVPFDDMHVDHVIALANGGEHSYANTQPAHPVCNLRKGTK